MLASISDNIFLFLEYLEAKLDTSLDTLNAILSLREDLSEHEFSQIFVRVCAAYSDGAISVDSCMVRAGMSFLIDHKVDSTAAYGLLRILFNNSIDVTEAPVDLLLRF